MKIDRLSVKNFRCYREYNVTFSEGINVIIGENATGKTSLAEAVFALSFTKSPRISDEKVLIKDGCDNFFISGDFCGNLFNKYKISYGYDGEKKVIKKNQAVVRKISDYVGTIDVVWFSANDLFLFVGSPQNRRSNFDRIMCQISKVYYAALSNYKKFLKERNALLKRLNFENSKQLKVLLESLNEGIILEGKKIINIRAKTIHKINELLNQKHAFSKDQKELLQIKYCNSVDVDNYSNVLNDSYIDDLRRGNTSFGPHKDDYIFIINNKNIVEEGSQGQQRNAILNLKLAEVELINEVKKETPILVLDDVFSELDEKRKNNILKRIPEGVQIIITATSLVEIDRDVVEKANIISLKGDN